MSTETKRLSVFDTWVLTEAKRVIGEIMDIDDRDETTDAAVAIGRIVADYAAKTDPPDGFDETLQRFREHTEARRAFDEESAAHSKSASALEALLVEEFQREGTQSIKRDGKTFFLQSEVSATVAADKKAEAVEAARGLGLNYLIVLSPQSFAAYAREMLRENEGKLPPEFDGIANVREAQRLRMRAS